MCHIPRVVNSIESCDIEIESIYKVTTYRRVDCRKKGSDPNGTYLVMCHQKDTQLATESTEEHGNIS